MRYDSTNEFIDFETLFKTTHARLCKHVYQLVKDKEAAADIVQNVFLKYWVNRNTITIHTSKEAYLFKACINEAYNFLKSDKRRSSFNQTLSLTSNQSANYTEENIDFKDTDNQIRGAINALPPGCKQVFLLSRYEEMSHQEIAQYLNISVNTVNNHIKKALQILRDFILCIMISAEL